MMNKWDALHRFYLENPNYKIIETPDAAEPDLAVIYFSSLGTFNHDKWQQRLETDYYEFHRNPVRRAGKHIYVRDVALAFYMMGVNSKVNSIEKLLELLQNLTAGYKVVTVGVSSGGFMAMLAGAYLKAQYVISISGIIDVGPQQPGFAAGASPWAGPWNFNYLDNRKIVESSGVPVFQFESSRCSVDFPNAEKMRQMQNVRIFNIDSDSHGGQLNSLCIAPLLNLSFDQIEALSRRYSGKIISQWTINRTLLPLKHLLRIYLTLFRKKLFKFKFKPGRKHLTILGITFIDYEKPMG